MPYPQNDSFRVALVGLELPSEENLGLRYVAGALAGAGFVVEVHALNGSADVERVARALATAQVPLVGLAISDASAVVSCFAFARYLREMGFLGHLTAGGAVATLARHAILARHPPIDSVVRHAGEIPTVELARRLAAGVDWHDAPGLTTRNGDGPPCAPGLEPFAVRPLRSENLHRVLGVPVAQLVASRGCTGGCRYCGSPALRRMAVHEGRRAGLTAASSSEQG